MKLEISWASANAVTTRSTRLTKFGLIKLGIIILDKLAQPAVADGFNDHPL